MRIPIIQKRFYSASTLYKHQLFTNRNLLRFKQLCHGKLHSHSCFVGSCYTGYTFTRERYYFFTHYSTERLQKASIMSMLHTTSSYKYKLCVRQHPKQARTSNLRDGRTIEPPPILELVVTDSSGKRIKDLS